MTNRSRDSSRTRLTGAGMDLVWAAETADAAKDSGGYWQLALILAAIGFLGLFSRWRKMRKPVVIPAKELRERDENPNRYRDTADRAIVELLETSRVLNAQVDTKIRVLNRLVKEAEENCSRLEKLLAEARSELERPAGERAAGRGADPAGEKAGAAEAKKEEAAPASEPEFLSELHERIYRLKVEGRSVAEIARTTNLSTTEVEFIVRTF